MRQVGGGEELGAPRLQRASAPEVHRRSRHGADRGVAILVVVPGKGRPQERAGARKALEAARALAAV